jgi:uncharacterized membrane protein
MNFQIKNNFYHNPKHSKHTLEIWLNNKKKLSWHWIIILFCLLILCTKYKIKKKKIGMWEDEHIDHDRIELNLISVMSYIYINIRWNCYVLSDPIYLMLP